MNFKVGDFINWLEPYDDGIPGKDYGDGIIIERKNTDHRTYGDYILYKIYRNKHKDVCWFEEQNLTPKEK